MGRIEEVKRVTRETNVSVQINVDGTGIADNTNGIPFLDHMLDQLASHGLFDAHVKAMGDLHIDDHHTNEDVALAIGTVQLVVQTLLQALGNRKGTIDLDLSGGPYLSFDLQLPTNIRYLVPKECCPALDEGALFMRHKPSNIIFKLLEFIP